MFPGRRNGSAGATGHAHIWEFDGNDWLQIGENIWGKNSKFESAAHVQNSAYERLLTDPANFYSN